MPVILKRKKALIGIIHTEREIVATTTTKS
jgi:hypothetical protein